MASQTARRFATYADIEALPEHQVGELIDGELCVHSRPAPRHAEAGSSLLVELKGAFQWGRGGPGGWLISPEPELHLRAEVVAPDVAGWRKEALPRLPDIAYFTPATAWVCEALSDSNETLDRGKKMAIYARHGVRDVWLIDPAERELEAFVNDDGVFRPAGAFRGPVRVRVPPFAGRELDLALPRA
jgi:Uma2 family endonuclease